MYNNSIYLLYNHVNETYTVEGCKLALLNITLWGGVFKVNPDHLVG